MSSYSWSSKHREQLLKPPFMSQGDPGCPGEPGDPGRQGLPGLKGEINLLVQPPTMIQQIYSNYKTGSNMNVWSLDVVLQVIKESLSVALAHRETRGLQDTSEPQVRNRLWFCTMARSWHKWKDSEAFWDSVGCSDVVWTIWKIPDQSAAFSLRTSWTSRGSWRSWFHWQSRTEGV